MVTQPVTAPAPVGEPKDDLRDEMGVPYRDVPPEDRGSEAPNTSEFPKRAKGVLPLFGQGLRRSVYSDTSGEFGGGSCGIKARSVSLRLREERGTTDHEPRIGVFPCKIEQKTTNKHSLQEGDAKFKELLSLPQDNKRNEGEDLDRTGDRVLSTPVTNGPNGMR